jgi:hypothetical protein
MRLVGTLAAALGALVLSGPGAAAPGIESISPAVADRGGTVRVTGNGFGGPTVRITVGGEPVALLSATGSMASFRVPALGPVGEVTVEARNPGGLVGRVGLTVRFDGHTAAVADEEAAVSADVGNDGGTIGVAGMTLAIPAGAVPEGTTITATPLRSLTGSPFAGRPVGLKLEPSGLVLLRPASLTLPKPTGAGTVVGFGFDGDGTDFHLVPATVSGSAVEVKVWHFSGAGTLTATLSELSAVLDYQTTRAHGRAEQRIAAALVDAELNGSDPAQAIFDALAVWRVSVDNGLQIVRDTGRLDFFELAFGEWQAWLAFVQEYRDSLTAAHNSFLDAAIQLDRSLATAAAYDVGVNVLAGCIGPGVPRSALRDVLRLATAVVVGALPIDQANDPNQRQLPTGDGLARACLDVELLAFEHAPTFARNRDNRFTARARVVFWDGPPSTTIPLRYRLRDASAGPTPSLASGTSATGAYEDSLTPATLGSRTYELTADLDTGGGDAVLRAFFDRTTETLLVRERLDLLGRRPGDAGFTDSIGSVSPGTAVSLRVRLAGDDVAAKTVTLTHDGNGGLPASAITDANGEATISYTAPASAQIELVIATIAEGAFTSGDAIVITTRDPVVVTVTPSFGFAGAGGTVQFGAAVTGTPDDRVSWNVSGGGTISASGLFTAGSVSGTFTVTAVSLAEPSSTGTAFVMVSSATVQGRYTGTICRFDDLGDSNCADGLILDYGCSFQSNIHAGATCGWFSGQGIQQVPNTIPLCFIETDGTTAGGAFTGRVTFCRFRPASTYERTRIEGTIGNGRLEAQVYAPGFDGTERLWERISFTKVP